MSDHLAAAREWFERGDRDIEAAQLLQDEQFYADVIAYHLQQAIEKYLKGFLVFNDVHPPRTHDLDALLNLASTLARVASCAPDARHDVLVSDLLREAALFIEWSAPHVFAGLLVDLAGLQRELLAWRRAWPLDELRPLTALHARNASDRLLRAAGLVAEVV